MAIKDFIIGPQNYWEEGYFDGDYTLPNVSKSFLECDIDNIKGGRVVTGLYYQDDYIDGTYWHDNSIRAELVADAMIVQVATVSLQGYYQEGYFSEGYTEKRGSQFFLTAELTIVGEDVFATGAWISESTMTIAVSKTVDAESTVSVTFSQTVNGQRDRDIDLFAFSNAAIAVSVDRIRNNNISVSAVFDIATDFRRFRDLSAEETSLFDLSIANQRSRDTNIETQAAFSMTAVIGKVTEYSATMSASLSMSAALTNLKSINLTAFTNASVSVSATVTAVIISNQTANSLLAVQSVKRATVSSNLSQLTQLSMLGGRSIGAQSIIRSYGEALTSRYIGTDRPVTITGSFDGSSLINSATRTSYLSRVRQASNWFFEINGYIDPTGLWEPVDVKRIFNIPLGNKGNVSAEIRYRASQGVTFTIGALGISRSFATGILNIDSQPVFYTIGVSFVNGGSVAIYMNGTRLSTSNNINTAGWTITNPQTVQFAPDFPYTIAGSTHNSYINYAWFTYGNQTSSNASSYTVTSRTNTEDTIFLYQFNGNGQESLTLSLTGSAALSMTASLSAQANPNIKQTQASLTTTSNVSSVLTRLVTVDAVSASSQTQLAVTAQAQKTVQSQFTTQTTQTTNSTRLKFAEITAGSLFTPGLIVQATKAGVSLLESKFSQTAAAVKTVNVLAQNQSISSITVNARLIARSTVSISAVSAVTITNQRVRYADSAMAVQSQVIVTATIIEPAASNPILTFTMSVTAFRTQTAAASVSSLSIGLAQAVKTTNIVSNQSTAFAQNVIGLRLRQPTASVNGQFNTVITAVKTARSAVSNSTVTNSTVAAVKTTNSLAPLGALFAPYIDADITARPLIQLESRFAQNTLAGTLKTLDRNYLGIRSSGSIIPRIGPLSGQTTFGTNIQSVGFVASVWARRQSVGNHYAVLWSPYQFDLEVFPTYRTALIIDGDNVRLRSTFDADEGGATWDNSAPQDTEWHHYLLVSDRNFEPTGPAQFFRLWIDGVYLGERNYSAVMQGNVFNNGGYLRFGQGTPRTIYDESWLSGTQEFLDFAQIWIGILDTEPVTPGGAYRTKLRDPSSLFYDNGFIDLGTNGQGSLNQLPQPRIYSRLGTPYTDINFVNSGGITQPAQPSALPLYTDLAQAQTNLTVTPAAVLLTQVEITSLSTVNAQVSYSIFEDADLNCEFTVTANAQQFIGIISNQISESSLAITVAKTVGYQSNITATATITTQVGFFDSLSADLSVNSELVCEFQNVPPIRGEANLLSVFTVTADASSFTDSITLMSSAGILACEFDIIPPTRGTAELVSAFTVTAVIGSIEQFAVLVDSLGSMSVTAVKTARAQSTAPALTQTTVSPVKFTGIIETFTAFNAVLSTGEVINIDPYLTLVIEPESRGLFILEENRIITIESETRVNII